MNEKDENIKNCGKAFGKSKRLTKKQCETLHNMDVKFTPPTMFSYGKATKHNTPFNDWDSVKLPVSGEKFRDLNTGVWAPCRGESDCVEEERLGYYEDGFWKPCDKYSKKKGKLTVGPKYIEEHKNDKDFKLDDYHEGYPKMYSNDCRKYGGKKTRRRRRKL